MLLTWRIFWQEFKGYVFKIMGVVTNKGFPMKQCVLTTRRVHHLLHNGIFFYFITIIFFIVLVLVSVEQPEFRLYMENEVKILSPLNRYSLFPWLW